MALEAVAPADEPAGGMAGDGQTGNATNRPESADLRLGIVGAGKLGTTLARAAIEAGYDVGISGSGPADDISLTVDVLAPGARALTTEEAVRHADIIALAIPAHRFRELPPHLFAGKILIDATNYWEPVDGADEDLAAAPNGTSIVVRDHFPGARVVKSLNQLGYHELEETRRPTDAPDRIAVGAAGDDRLAVRAVMRLVDRLGFDPVDAGPLGNGLALQPDGSPYATTYTATQLSDLISQTQRPVVGSRTEAGLKGIYGGVNTSDRKGAAMPERDRYIPGVPCWVDTSQPDPEAAVQFYSGLFGWEFEDVMPPGVDGSYFIGRMRGGDVAAVGSIAKGVEPVAVWNTYIWSDSADAAASRVTGAGGEVLTEPFDVMDAGRMAVFADPEGAVFNVWQAKRRRGAQVVNEPGSLNFNGLNTRNREAAKKFYGHVFGWQTLAIGGGLEAWTLGAYGDHLAIDRPTIRQEMGDTGAPGFEDVVATLNAIGDDQPDTPAHWSVTFAVADADATAEKAEKLGGKLVMPPFDAPWVRTTVIADPQGATLIASQFVPENRDKGERDGASEHAG